MLYDSTVQRNPAVWLPSAQLQPIPEEIIRSCFLAMTFMYQAQRRPYGQYWSEDGDAFSLSLDAMKMHLESHRKQGLQFRIIELPAIVLRSAGNDLLLIDICSNGYCFFTGQGEPRLDGHTLRAVACAIRDLTNVNVRFHIEPAGSVRIAELPYRMYQSEGYGRNTPLFWRAMAGLYEPNSAMSLCTQICTHVHRSTLASS